MARIENWCVTTYPDPYLPPEAQAKALHGIVFDHPRFEDGAEVTTGPVVRVAVSGDNVIARTQTGTEYLLGQIDPEYEKAYPNARERIAKTFAA